MTLFFQLTSISPQLSSSQPSASSHVSSSVSQLELVSSDVSTGDLIATGGGVSVDLEPVVSPSAVTAIYRENFMKYFLIKTNIALA